MFSLFNYFKSAPPLTIWQSHPGQKSRVLITAGVDGDEYAGIKAASKLMESYSMDIPLTIIPIVNLAGYRAKSSYNPLDHRLPKLIYPGSRFGSSSAVLMHNLFKQTEGVELWIDLHGGATDEHLPVPFIWASDSYPILSHLTGRILVEKSVRKNIPYLMLEAGELGQIDSKSENTHLNWIYSILNNLDETKKQEWRPTYTKIHSEKNVGQEITPNTLWYSENQIVKAS